NPVANSNAVNPASRQRIFINSILDNVAMDADHPSFPRFEEICRAVAIGHFNFAIAGNLIARTPRHTESNPHLIVTVATGPVVEPKRQLVAVNWPRPLDNNAAAARIAIDAVLMLHRIPTEPNGVHDREAIHHEV